MSYNSFYGGEKGTSFVIVKNYPDVPTMCEDFRKGESFTEVNYDEYVIINTANKNHADNGKVFRRGYDYNSGRTISYYKIMDSNTGAEIINGYSRLDPNDESTWTEHSYLSGVTTDRDDIDAGGAVYVGTIVGPAGRAPML
jgi:hypothetical protein